MRRSFQNDDVTPQASRSSPTRSSSIGASERKRDSIFSSSDASSASETELPTGNRADTNSTTQHTSRTYANFVGNESPRSDPRRKTVFTHKPSGALVQKKTSNPSSSERKGLFEQDDDMDSLETFRQRIKLRQTKRKTEMENFKVELESAKAKLSELEAKILEETKGKEEYAIRANECQRIIEKRNKQLIKASERIARYTEQTENQITDLKHKLTEAEQNSTRFQQELENKHAVEIQALKDEMTKMKQNYEAELEKSKCLYETRLEKKQAEIVEVENKVKALKKEVDAAPSLVLESEPYQILLKRVEDAEAISRGLKHQLAKEQNEKKFIKKQLSGIQQNAPLPTAGAFIRGSDPSLRRTTGGDLSPSSTSSADLSNFDFFPNDIPGSPQTPKVTSSATVQDPNMFDISPPIIEVSEKSDSRVSVEGSYDEDAQVRDELIREASSDPNREEKPAGVARMPSNFFEKISIRFKRNSPRNSFNNSSNKTKVDASPLPTTSTSLPTSPQAHVDTTVPSASLPSVQPVVRPKMFVHRVLPGDDDEESSDSILGSDSDGNDDSEDSEDFSSDQESDESTPPLPPDSPQMAVDQVAQNVPSPRMSQSRRISSSQPPLPPRDSGDEAASESSNADEGETDERNSTSDAPPPPPSPPSESPHQYNQSKNFASKSNSSDEEAANHRRLPSSDSNQPTRQCEQSKERERSRSKDKKTRSSIHHSSANSHEDSSNSIMNDYIEERARKLLEKIKRKAQKEEAAQKKQADYEKEWEKLAQEEKERKQKRQQQQQQRRSGRRRPSSMKTMRVSQMQLRQQMMNNLNTQTDATLKKSRGGDSESSRNYSRSDAGRDAKSESDDDEPPLPPQPEPVPFTSPMPDEPPSGSTPTVPLPPQPTEVDSELYLRQQARLRERHELEVKKKKEAEEADQIRGQVHKLFEKWAFGKELLHLILTLDQISNMESLKQFQLMVIQAPDNETLRKAYRGIIRVIHPDKLRNASIPEQLETKELFTILNQAFEDFKLKTGI